jgi:hypothetical protein
MMDLKDLRKAAKEGCFVEGIYNYCDRWCEQCSFTSKCLLYAQEQLEPEEEDLGLEDESFWKKLETRLVDTQKIIIQAAEELGIDPEELVKAAENEPERLRLNIEDHALSRAALNYAKRIQDFFEREENLTLREYIHQETAEDEQQAVEVIRWFQFQIAVKVTSALNSRIDEEDEELPGEQKHSDGCAKVSLIGIDRSIAGWELLLRHHSAEPEILRSILAQLKKLRREIEDAFPEARNFLRPGFDFSVQ